MANTAKGFFLSPFVDYIYLKYPDTHYTTLFCDSKWTCDLSLDSDDIDLAYRYRSIKSNTKFGAITNAFQQAHRDQKIEVPIPDFDVMIDELCEWQNAINGREIDIKVLMKDVWNVRWTVETRVMLYNSYDALIFGPVKTTTEERDVHIILIDQLIACYYFLNKEKHIVIRDRSRISYQHVSFEHGSWQFPPYCKSIIISLPYEGSIETGTIVDLDAMIKECILKDTKLRTSDVSVDIHRHVIKFNYGVSRFEDAEKIIKDLKNFFMITKIGS